VIELARAAWQQVIAEPVDWEDLCMRSDSDWDVAVKRLTPDLPCWLADFVAVDIQCADSVGLFWAEVRHNLTLDQCSELRRWYERTALDLTGESVAFDLLD
jgi:hypothetical protein